MPIHHAVTFPLIIMIAIVGALFSMLSARHSSGAWFVPLWSRKRDSFSETGWRYRTWSVLCGYLCMAVVVLDQLVA